DFNNNNNDLVLPGYTGAIKFVNMTNINVSAMVGLERGVVILDSTTCTAGSLTITGIGELQDEAGNNIPTGSWNGMTIINNLMSNDSIATGVWSYEE
ncbi:MAG: hypothetical protein U9Q40_05625, partial [Campylobacterota bacterium]|nr:hypothetical protein [Campylobacterota bacterium]